MKSIQSLTQQLEQWRQECATLYSRQTSSAEPPESRSGNNGSNRARRDRQSSASRTPPVSGPALWKTGWKKRMNSTVHSPVSLVLAVVCLTGALGHRFYNQPQLAVGTIAPQSFEAPEDAKVKDVKTTEENRKAARIGSTPVLTIDRPVNQQINRVLEKVLQEGQQLRGIAGAFPFVNPSQLPLSAQRYLRQAPEWEYQAVLAAVVEDKALSQALPNNSGNLSDSDSSTDVLQRGLLTPRGEEAVAALQGYRQQGDPDRFSALVNEMARIRQRYATALDAIERPSSVQSTRIFEPDLLELSDAEWQQTQIGIKQALEPMLSQGIPPGLPDNLLKSAAIAQLQDRVPENAEALASTLLLKVLQPNLIKDLERTRDRAEQAAREVKPVYVSIEQGETIVAKGETISQAQFVLLDRFGMSRREINWMGLFGFSGCVTVAVGIFWLVERRTHPKLRRRDRALVLMLSLSVPLLISLGVPYTSLPAVGLLVGSFYGSALGSTAIALLSFLLPIGMEIEGTYLVANAVGGILAGFLAGRMRSREELALVGGAVGGTQGVVYLLATLILSATAGSIWYTILGVAAKQALAGVAWCIIAIGLSPYLEHLFDLITPIRLAELANPNRPLLQRLATEAPGTFQHTLFVATLAEAAAKELHCNVELVRTGTLYHDIGKMHDALGFIENQMGGPNKHDDIDDPWVSAEIIKKHVSEGLVMARKCRLPKAIQAFIPEHQGTMLIAYFYHQAKQRAESQGHEVRESDFRYVGPIPQSRETGIVMLADSCEAALRSLKEATPDDALNMVNKILKARWQDNQLVDSGLTREEMPKIAEIFVRVWQQFNHKRIAYPKGALSLQRK